MARVMNERLMPARENLFDTLVRMVVKELQPAPVPENPYVVPELRGDSIKLWESRDLELMLSGPAETGKTYASLSKLNALMWDNPGVQGAMIRKTYQSMHGSVLQTFRRILGKNTPVHAYGGEKPEWFDYPNGSRLFVGGMDNPQKVLSSERDIIYVNQAEELDRADWETLTTRATGRGSVMPYTQIYGDCNPGPATHWILDRPSLRVLQSKHEDNPTLFDKQGTITEQGKRTLSVLDALTGPRKQRLRYGKWTGAEGMVYETWDKEIHVIDPFHIPSHWPRYRVIDFGYTNPFVCLWVAEDDDGRLYVYREMYHTQRLVEDWARAIQIASKGERIEFTLADHDAEDRATLDAHGVPTIAAIKNVSAGIQAVQARLKVAGDGKPRLVFFRDCLVEADLYLEEKHRPVSTVEEFEGYVWAKQTGGGDRIKEQPVKADDHGLDGVRYLVFYLDGGEDEESIEEAFRRRYEH